MESQNSQNFLISIKMQFPKYFEDKLVLDVGSLDSKEKSKFLFTNCLYLGVDARPGQNVDLICEAYQLALPDASFDVVISTKYFQPDQFYARTIKNIIRLLKAGGMFLFTSASSRMESEFRAVIELDKEFAQYQFSLMEESDDLCFWGIKKGAFVINEPDRSRLRDKQFASLVAMEGDRTTGLAGLQELEEIKRSSFWKLRLLGQTMRQLLHGDFEAVGTAIRKRLLKKKSLRVIAMVLQSRRLRGQREVAVSFGQSKSPEELYTKSRGLRFKNARVIAPPKGRYVGHLIKNFIESNGVKCDLVQEYRSAATQSDVNFVICPQMYVNLPADYFAFQMEATTRPGLFSTAYFASLSRAKAVLDYSIHNIEFMKAAGMTYSKLFFAPIGPLIDYPVFLKKLGISEARAKPAGNEVVLYGDPHSERHQRILRELRGHFAVRLVSELNGDMLLGFLASAVIVVSVHHHVDDLLETSRIFECLSLGIPVVSESSLDAGDYGSLQSIVEFTPVGDIDAMVVAISRLRRDQDLYAEKKRRIGEFVYSNRLSFDSWMARALYAYDLISFETLEAYYANEMLKLPDPPPSYCLSLPETTYRRESFISQSCSGEFQFYDAVRHSLGWIGCASSYKLMMRYYLSRNVNMATICEDDVIFKEDHMRNMKIIREYLGTTSFPWHVFCGVIANLHPLVRILRIEDFGGLRFIFLDKMTSTVCNVYSRKGMELISNWSDSNRDKSANTIDRYLENHPELVAVTTLPFIVGHDEEQFSSIWGFKNTKYLEMIRESERLLSKKMMDHLSSALKSGGN